MARDQSGSRYPRPVTAILSRLVLVPLLAVAACAEPDVALTHQPVIGGDLTPAGRYPATGALMTDLGDGPVPTCSGTLIGPRAVLTAAHCLDPELIGNAIPGFTLALDANAAGAEEIVAGAALHEHPSFDLGADITDGIGHWYDIGVLELAADAPTHDYEILPSPDEATALADVNQVGLVGYGLTSNDAYEVGVKHDGTADLVNVGDWELFIAQPGQQQNCNGDSGGPAFADLDGQRRIVGTVSRSPDSNTVCDHGGIDTRVNAYLDWIHQNADVPCGGLKAPCSDSPGGGGCNSTPPTGLLGTLVSFSLLFRKISRA